MSRDYQRVEAAIRFLEEHAVEQPSLADVAAAVGLSEHHFHRLFRQWAGITPKRFLQLLTLEHAKRMLDASSSVLEASFRAGLSGPSRLHDLFVNMEGLTPGEHRTGGAGIRIRWGVAATPFGTAFVASTDRGVCHLSFLPVPRRPTGGEGAEGGPAEGGASGRAPVDATVRELAERWPGAVLSRDDATAAAVLERVFDGDGIPLEVRGTNFQVQVWQALLTIPSGVVASYEDVARGIGRPEAVRAVAGAVARNRVAWLIPCHRVIRKVGEAGGYRWGTVRKRAMLAWEAAAMSRAGGENEAMGAE